MPVDASRDTYQSSSVHPMSHPDRRHRPAFGAALAALCVFAAACGGGDDAVQVADGADFEVQGERVVELDESATPPTTIANVAAGAGEAANASAPEPTTPSFDETESTIPTNDDESAEEEFFDAVGDFMACLSTDGYRFIGLPNEAADETDPVNDPGYLEALQSCAASTRILDKMDAAEDTSDLSAEEIEETNRQFTEFVDCLVGRGWTIPPLTPDENGVLQTPYVQIAQTWIPPDGTSILGDGTIDTDDFTECGFVPDSPD